MFHIDIVAMNDRKRTWWKDPEMITALSAVMIGLVALVIGAYQAKVASDQRAASVWPYLEISRYSIQGEKFGFNIINKGVGPALIKQMDVFVGDEPQERWSNVFKTMLDKDIAIRSIYSSTNKSVIAVQEKISMVDLQEPDVINLVQAIEDNIKIKVCYCSIFDDCWLSGRGIETVQVKSCKGTLPDRFIQ